MYSAVVRDRNLVSAMALGLLAVLASAIAARAEINSPSPNVSGSRNSRDSGIEATSRNVRLASLKRPVRNSAERASAANPAGPLDGSVGWSADFMRDQVDVSDSENPTYERADVLASKRYFDSVAEHVRELRRRKRAVSYGQIGKWIQICAGRIDRLAVLGVDSQLVEYGQKVASDLRDVVGEIQASGIRASVRQAEIQPEFYGDVVYYEPWPYFAYWGWRPGYWRYDGDTAYWHVNLRTIKGERRKIRAQERARAAQAHRLIMQEIENQTAQIRWEMTDKYQVEF